MKTITVRTREAYGETRIYPVCRVATLLADLAGTKTFTPAAIAVIKDLGYQIQVEQPPVRSV